jgi:hypothetical protein
MKGGHVLGGIGRGHVGGPGLFRGTERSMPTAHDRDSTGEQSRNPRSLGHEDDVHKAIIAPPDGRKPIAVRGIKRNGIPERSCVYNTRRNAETD